MIIHILLSNLAKIGRTYVKNINWILYKNGYLIQWK